jgi:hypothetical protein
VNPAGGVALGVGSGPGAACADATTNDDAQTIANPAISGIRRMTTPEVFVPALLPGG